MVSLTDAVPDDAPRVVAGLAGWLSAELDDPGPFRLVPIPGGNSNETLAVGGEHGQWVLRRPPRTSVAPDAHNLEREFRVLRALAAEAVPTPRAIAYTADPAVTPVPCLLLEHVPGSTLQTDWPPDWTVAQRHPRAVGEAAIDALVQLHAVDWRGAGLAGFGRPDGYLERQVSRWRVQYEHNQVRDLPLFERLCAWLEGNRPAATTPTVIHGDFRFDNCLFVPGDPVRVNAVIDWELSTIGDPLVDLGLLLAFWGTGRPEPMALPDVQTLSRAPGSPSRAELAAYYAERSGRPVEALDFYMTLALVKLAAIVEGAYANFCAGHDRSEYARSLAHNVPRLLAEAAVLADL